MMKVKNEYGRLCFILLITLATITGFYWLPDNICGYPIRKIDILSDIRVKVERASLDSLQNELKDILLNDIMLTDSTRIRGFDSAQIVLRDSIYNVIISDGVIPDDSGQIRVEDFSIGHTGFHHFFSKLNQIHQLDRPVRIAFLGDSFIEGDILVADFRAKMQDYFGGHGVGFVPLSSKVEQYRPTINQRSQGWKIRTILSDKKYKYTLPGLLFEPENDEVTVTFKTVNTYPGLGKITSLKFIYNRNDNADILFIFNEKKDTIFDTLPPTGSIAQYEINGDFKDGNIRITNTFGLQALGLALECNKGVIVDNFSLRGNTGMILEELDEASCISLREIRPYDLIILQYGLNVATETMLEYGWYRERMVKVIHHVQKCFPEADILLLGISDRSFYKDGKYQTMPAVVSLLRSQRQAAELAKVPFWSIFRAMGGENSMDRYVNYRWASKDHTHLSFRGGKEIANSLFNALLLEKKLYDEMERSAYQ